jgi:FkbM family methyltransferase
MALSEPDAVFADIGALYGYFSCWAGRHAPSVPVFAFEPEPQWTAVLRRNLALNNVEATVEEVALTDKDGPVSFHDRTVEPNGSGARFRRNYPRATLNWLHRNNERPHQWVRSGYTEPTFSAWEILRRTRQVSIERKRHPPAVAKSHSVTGISLDSWVRHGGTPPTVVKIDVHGGEGLVLRGGVEALHKHVKHLLLELHTPDYLVDTSHDEILNIILDLDLDLFELRGFRRRTGKLIELDSRKRRELCDMSTWNPEDLYYMRFLYARRR